MNENLNRKFVDRLKGEVGTKIGTPGAIHPDDQRAYEVNILEVTESIFRDLCLAAQSELMSSKALLKMIEKSQKALGERMVHANREGQDALEGRFQALETKGHELQKRIRDMRSVLEYYKKELEKELS